MCGCFSFLLPAALNKVSFFFLFFWSDIEKIWLLSFIRCIAYILVVIIAKKGFILNYDTFNSQAQINLAPKNHKRRLYLKVNFRFILTS